MLRIDLAPLGEGIHRFAFDPEPATLELDPEQFADIDVEVILDYHNRRALATLTARAVATLECDRTLQMFDLPVEGTYSVLFVPAALGGAGAEDDDAYSEVRVLDPSQHEIDLTEAARDTLVLALPARRVAPGAEDMELQTVYGEPEDEESDIDPRWEALRKLRSGDSDAQ